MNVTGSRAWRWLFMAGGLVYFAGSLQHPRGTMVEMLADPAWVRGHATIAVGIILMIAGLVTFRRSRSHSTQLGHWLRIAVIVSALEAVEMTIHTVANVDATALANGVSTPVLTTHLWLATLVYPLFGGIRVPHCRRAAQWRAGIEVDCADRTCRRGGARRGDATGLHVRDRICHDSFSDRGAGNFVLVCSGGIVVPQTGDARHGPPIFPTCCPPREFQ